MRRILRGTDMEKESHKIYKELDECLETGGKAVLVSGFKGVCGRLEEEFTKNIIVNPQTGEEREVLENGSPKFVKEESGFTLYEPFYPEERMIVLGGGHVALPLVEFSAKLGFRVTVVDDRISFANTRRFPQAHEVICDDFTHALLELNVKQSDYVVIITRGHRWDTECLRVISCGEEPCYVGMIGSRRRTAIVKQGLIEEGIPKKRLDAVHTPIGLAIGAVTPEEIGIAIAAEIIQWKRIEAKANLSVCSSDIDYDVLEALKDPKEGKRALLTIVESEGSAPRRAGAKMLVYPDGQLKGSIGGGCSEAAVILEARKMIGTGTYRLIDVDLTGEAAEEEGMVCGGTIKVLAEDLPL